MYGGLSRENTPQHRQPFHHVTTQSRPDLSGSQMGRTILTSASMSVARSQSSSRCRSSSSTDRLKWRDNDGQAARIHRELSFPGLYAASSEEAISSRNICQIAIALAKASDHFGPQVKVRPRQGWRARGQNSRPLATGYTVVNLHAA
jgi:hypothetical protein